MNEEVTLVETKEVDAPEVEEVTVVDNDGEFPEVVLRGSSKLADTLDIRGNEVSTKEVVQYAFAKSKMKAGDWNKLSGPKRDALIEDAINDLRKQLKPKPKATDGKPKLTLAEKQQIKDRRFAKEVAGQQWAGLAAIRGQIEFAPEKEEDRPRNDRKKQQQPRKPYVQKKK